MNLGRFLSAEPGRASAILECTDIGDGCADLELVDDESIVHVVAIPSERAPIAAALRAMAELARAEGGESPTKRVIPVGRTALVGIHATLHRVSVHVGGDRAELVVSYVQLEPADAEALAAALDG